MIATGESSFFHVREEHLEAGDLIHPGRWGSTVLSQGQAHPFYFREHLLEIWRRFHTTVSVSRLSSTFAFDNIDIARQQSTSEHFIYRVQPVEVPILLSRFDMLWLTWMGEAGGTAEKMAGWCAAYWSGKSTADLTSGKNVPWELIFPCALRIFEVVERGR